MNVESGRSNTKTDSDPVIDAYEIISFIVFSVLNIIDWITTIIVALKFIVQDNYQPCSIDVIEPPSPFLAKYHRLFGFVVIGITFLSIVLCSYEARLIFGDFGQKYCSWKEGPDLGARIMKQVKLEFMIHIFQDQIPGWILVAIGAMSGGSLSNSRAMLDSLIFTYVTGVFWNIKSIALNHYGELFGRKMTRIRDAIRAENGDYIFAIRVHFVMIVSLLVMLVVSLMLLRPIEVLVVDGKQYDYFGFQSIDFPDLGRCTIWCEEVESDTNPDFYAVDCEPNPFGDCLCTRQIVLINSCQTMQCDGHVFDVCFGECIAEGTWGF
eukprot:54054_1